MDMHYSKKNNLFQDLARFT